jgi:hypothetical protein
MKTENHLSPQDFIDLGIEHIVRCESPENFESTYQKRITDKEIYCFVHHYNKNELIICVHERGFPANGRLERLFKGTIANQDQLKSICKVLEIPQLNLN